MAWKLDWSSGTSLAYPTGYRWSVNIPKSPGTLNMITKGYPVLTVVPKSITMTFKVQSTKAIYKGTGDQPGDVTPTFRFYLQRKGDDMSGHGDFQFYRWWSNPVCYQFGSHDNAPFSITAQVAPNQWSSVMGKPGTANVNLFNAAWLNGNRMGITCGGHFFGHGVQLVSGQSALYCVTFSLTK